MRDLTARQLAEQLLSYARHSSRVAKTSKKYEVRLRAASRAKAYRKAAGCVAKLARGAGG